MARCRNRVPVKCIENKCNGQVVDKECIICGRVLKKNGEHLPNEDGMFGFTLFYRDGSTRQSKTRVR